MNNSLKCQCLFAFNSKFMQNLFLGCEYPWEILPSLHKIIEEIIFQKPEGYIAVSDGIIIGKNVQISDGAHIEAPCIIGHDSKIRHGAYIRGSVVIGNGCTVGNSSEIKNSIMMDYSQAPHFNYVGDSIVGEHTHLGAGAICSNLRSDGKQVRIKSEASSIDTGLRKLGAILADKVEIGCGSVLCPGTIIEKNTTVYPLTMARGVYPPDSIVKRDSSVTAKRK